MISRPRRCSIVCLAAVLAISLFKIASASQHFEIEISPEPYDTAYMRESFGYLLLKSLTPAGARISFLRTLRISLPNPVGPCNCRPIAQSAPQHQETAMQFLDQGRSRLRRPKVLPSSASGRWYPGNLG